MGNCCKKLFWCFNSKKRDPFDYLPISCEAQDIYHSDLTSIDMNVANVGLIRIKSSHFIKENKCLPDEFYDRLEHIGEGAYGLVVKVKPKLTNEVRAMKIISKQSIIFGVKETDILNEIKILKSLDHPNIIKIYEFFKDESFYYIISEFCEEGDLLTKMEAQKNGVFSEKIACNIMKQIFSAVGYLHSKKIFHGDLKLENILVDSSYYKSSSSGFSSQNSSNKFNFHANKTLFDIKLIDFGCSKIFAKEFDMTDVIGSACYLAPEVLENNYDELCDIWSCGVIMFILLSGKMPFQGQTEDEILKNVSKGKFDLKQKEFLKVSLEAKDLIGKLLTYDPKHRPNARAALRHPWFKVNSEKQILNEIPNVKQALHNLLKFGAERKFQQAVITFITHNLIKSEEVNNLRKIFECIDRDSDARINKADIKHAFFEVFGRKLEASEIELLFKNIDHDNSGFIEYEEFIRATISKEIVLNEDNLKMGFSLFDIDKSGFISAEEINKTIGGGKSIPDNLMVELLAEIGKDFGQEICFEEYKIIMNKIFICDKKDDYERKRNEMSSIFNENNKNVSFNNEEENKFNFFKADNKSDEIDLVSFNVLSSPGVLSANNDNKLRKLNSNQSVNLTVNTNDNETANTN